jgi:glycosyltransferase involved in cell wall biosynthesis
VRRLLVDGRWAGARPSGVGNAILRQLTGLGRVASAAGWEVFAVRPALAPAEAAAWNAITGIHQIIVDQLPEAHPRGDWWQQVSLPALARQLRADVLYSPAFTGPILPIGRTKRLLMVHDDLPWSQPDSYPLSFRLYLRTLCQFAARSADRVLVPSKDVKRRLTARLGLAPQRIAVVPHGLEGARYLPSSTVTRQPIVLYIASSEPRKNHEVLFRAAKLLPRGVQLVFVGYRVGEEELLRLRRQYPGPWEVIPQASETEIIALLASAQLLVHPSLGEGFGFPLLEAMAAGVPVLAADIPVLREVLGSAGRYALPHDPQAWGSAIEAILSDPALQEDLRQGGLERARLFSLERCARRIIRIADQAIGAQRASPPDDFT